MPHPYGGETAPMTVQDLARPQQQGWLSFSSQYEPTRQMQGRRRPFDRPRKRKGKGAAQGG